MKILLICAVQLAVASAFAGSFDNCKTEIKKFKCKGNEMAVYQCLETNSKGLSAKCEAAHEAFEKKNNITPDESHEDVKPMSKPAPKK